MESKIVKLCCWHKVPYHLCPEECGYAAIAQHAMERRNQRLTALALKKQNFEELKRSKTISCARCGKPHYSRFGGRFCSSRCKYEPVKKPPKKVRQCVYCAQPISRRATKFCSLKCFHASIESSKKCSVCAAPVKTGNKYCSKACRSTVRLSRSTRAKTAKTPKQKICGECQSTYLGRRSKYCSEGCANKVDHRSRNLARKRRKRASSQKARESFQPEHRECPHCKKQFTTSFFAPTKIYCSARCSKRYKAARRKKNIPHLRMKDAISGRLRDLLKQQGLKKQSPIATYFGKTPQELREWISSRFTEGMTWENYGPSGWHIDHYIPCHRFDLSNEKHVKVCFNWRNLRPLWGKDNIRRQHWMSLEERLLMDEELYRMATNVGIRL